MVAVVGGEGCRAGRESLQNRAGSKSQIAARWGSDRQGSHWERVPWNMEAEGAGGLLPGVCQPWPEGPVPCSLWAGDFSVSLSAPAPHGDSSQAAWPRLIGLGCFPRVLQFRLGVVLPLSPHFTPEPQDGQGHTLATARTPLGGGGGEDQIPSTAEAEGHLDWLHHLTFALPCLGPPRRPLQQLTGSLPLSLGLCLLGGGGERGSDINPRAPAGDPSRKGWAGGLAWLSSQA